MPDPRHLPADLAGWLSYLEQLHPKPIALGLERVGEVAARLALRPSFPVITIAGTNGKGSTSAMLERIYLEAGYHVACYTSPHLLRYNERVRIDGIEASDDELCRAFAHVESARGDIALTYFEFGTLAAMWLFMQRGVDVGILEVGLGGRLDAVNIFDPACAIVTSVDLDHQEFLGNDRESIGREKAGVYRAGVPAICGELETPRSVIDHAREIGAALRCIERDFSFHATGNVAEFRSGANSMRNLPLPALRGSFQCSNAACALEAVHAIQSRLAVPQEAIARGLQRVSLGGRFQAFGDAPRVILDVAHNPHAARGLAENLRRHPVPGRTFAVFAMLADKDIAGVIRLLIDDIDVWCVAGIDQPRGAGADQLVACLRAVRPAVALHRCDSVLDAYRAACLQAGEDDRIVAFGSFYTVADVMREITDTRSSRQD